MKKRKVEAGFDGGDVTGNGGIPLLAAVDRRLGCWTGWLGGWTIRGAGRAAGTLGRKCCGSASARWRWGTRT